MALLRWSIAAGRRQAPSGRRALSSVFAGFRFSREAISVAVRSAGTAQISLCGAGPGDPATDAVARATAGSAITAGSTS
jgi:hypothetical protein